jgi:hypothetical protein
VLKARNSQLEEMLGEEAGVRVRLESELEKAKVELSHVEVRFSSLCVLCLRFLARSYVLVNRCVPQLVLLPVHRSF